MIYFLTVNYYSTNEIEQLIKSIQLSGDIPYHIVIVNNSPDDCYIHLLKSETVLILESGTNLGFGNGCNLGLNWIYAQNSQAIVWLINPDAYLTPNSLEKIESFFNQFPEVSILGTAIYTPDGKSWFAGGSFIRQTGAILTLDSLTGESGQLHAPPFNGRERLTSDTYVNCDWVSGCSLIINLPKFPECPQFDPAYFLYYEDFDFCRRYATKGHVIGITKQLSVVHQPSTITNRNKFKKYQYSTYSYLITLERYTNNLILIMRLTRLIAYALILIGMQPKVAFGKLYGVLIYLRHRCHLGVTTN